MADYPRTGLQPEFMTLGELAAYLSVSERTIYGWAQRGEIPAYKLGAAWRFRRDEIDHWLRTRRSGPALVAHGDRCSVCSRDLTSELQAAGNCTHPQCGQPICRSCWGILRRRNCSAHLPSKRNRGAEGELATSEGGASTTVVDQVQHSEISQSLLSERFLDGFSKRVEGRPYLVGSSGTYIAHVDNSLWLKSSGTGEPYEQVSGSSSGDSSGPRVLETKGWVAYRVKLPRRALGSTNSILRMEARAVGSTVRRISRFQLQSPPIKRTQLEQLLDGALSFAKSEGISYVLGLYAPQGWTGDALGMLNHPNISHRFLHTALSVALIGADLDQVCWNSNDHAIGELWPYYREVERHEIAMCTERIQALLTTSGVHMLRGLIDEEEFGPHAVHEAIRTLVGAEEVEVICEQGEELIVRKR